MRYLTTLVLAGGILAATAGESSAQFAVSVGNPYYGQGVAIGNPGFAYGYSSGYSNFARPAYPVYTNSYNTYSNSAYVAGPGAFSYSSGYRGFAPPVVGYGYPARVTNYGYVNRPYYANPGYGSYGYAPVGGFRPFRGANSWLR